MLLLANSSVHQSGVSTLTFGIAYSYSNWVNRPALIVSMGSDRFYKEKCKMDESYEAKNLSIVNGNTTGHGDIKTYTYKFNDLLYYYHANSTPNTPMEMRLSELRTFLEKASREFGLVILDIDNSVSLYSQLLDIADSCIFVLPPDDLVLKNTGEMIYDVFEEYKEKRGVPVRTKMIYLVNKSDAGATKINTAKLLKVPQKEVFILPYDNRFIRMGNRNKLGMFYSDTLINSTKVQDKIIERTLSRIYDILRRL